MDIQLAEVLNHKSMAIFVDEKVAAIAANISSRRIRYGTAAYHAKIGYVRAARDVCCRTKHQQTLPLARDVRNRDRRAPILMAKTARNPPSHAGLFDGLRTGLTRHVAVFASVRKSGTPESVLYLSRPVLSDATGVGAASSFPGHRYDGKKPRLRRGAPERISDVRKSARHSSGRAVRLTPSNVG